MKCSSSALKSVSHWKEKPMGAALSFLGQKLFASSTLISAVREYLLLHLRRSRPPAHHPSDGRVPKEKDDDDLRGQPQESGRLGQRL